MIALVTPWQKYKLVLGTPSAHLSIMASLGVDRVVFIGLNGWIFLPGNFLLFLARLVLSAVLLPLMNIMIYFVGGCEMDGKLIDFILLRMNDFERLSRNEPSNYTAFETVRLCADILFRLGVNICCVNGVWRKL